MDDVHNSSVFQLSINKNLLLCWFKFNNYNTMIFKMKHNVDHFVAFITTCNCENVGLSHRLQRSSIFKTQLQGLQLWHSSLLKKTRHFSKFRILYICAHIWQICLLWFFIEWSVAYEVIQSYIFPQHSLPFALFLDSLWIMFLYITVLFFFAQRKCRKNT